MVETESRNPCSGKMARVALAFLTGFALSALLLSQVGSGAQLAVQEAAPLKEAALMKSLPRTLQGCPLAVHPVSRAAPVAKAATILLGSDSGGLVFQPDSLTVKAGESVLFKNNAGFPHNVVFDEDNVPDGVNAEALSKEDYLNAPGETHEVKFDKAGTYGYYCEPHRGAGMTGKIIVQ